MLANIKSNVQIRWSAGNSVLLSQSIRRLAPVFGIEPAGRTVPIGQIWVAMPEDTPRDSAGNSNVYFAGEVVARESFGFSYHSIAKFAANPGTLVLGATCTLPGIEDATATAEISYGICLRDPIKLLGQHALWMEPEGAVQLQAYIDKQITDIAEHAVGDGMRFWTSAEIYTEAAKLFEQINDRLLPLGLRLGGSEQDSRAQFSDFTAKRELPAALYELGLQVRIAEIEILQGILNNSIEQTAQERIQRDGTPGSGISLLSLIYQNSAVRDQLHAALPKTRLGTIRLTDYLGHLRSTTDITQDAVVRYILKSLLQSSPLLTG